MSKVAFRKCVVCRRSRPKSELLRFIVQAGRLTLDVNGSASGRGAYLDRELPCLTQAGAVGKWENAFRLTKGGLSVASVRELIAELTRSFSRI